VYADCKDEAHSVFMLVWYAHLACKSIISRGHTLGLHPVIHVPNYMDYYSFTDPEGWMAELAMLADR